MQSAQQESVRQSSDVAVTTTVQSGHLAAIDVLRGLAVTLVVLHHIHIRFLLNDIDVKQLLPAPLGRVLFWSGYQSVIAFFVISGFLITRVSLQRWGTLPAIDLRRFYWLRIARIWPCLLLLLAVLSVLHLASVPQFTINLQRASLTQAVIAALAMHFNWLEGRVGYLPGAWDILWSLSVEETFYAALPLVCVLLRRQGWLLLVAVALIVAGPLNRTALAGQEPWSSYAYLSCMDAIALGCLAAWFAQHRPCSVVMLRVLLTLGTAAVLLVIVFRKTAGALGLPALGLDVTVLALGIASILIALSGNIGHRALCSGTGWLRGIGRNSYEIYLVHMFVVLGGVRLFKNLRMPTQGMAAWYIAMLLISVAAGTLLARGYSVPLNRKLRGAMLTAEQRARLLSTS